MKKLLPLIFTFSFFQIIAQTLTFAAADSLFSKGRYQLALEELGKKPESFLLNTKKASIYESIDNYKEAMSFYEKALNLKDDVKTRLKLAKIYQRLKRTNKAIKIYEEILEKDSLNLVLKYKLGKLYLIKKKSEKAIEIFKYLIKKDFKNANYSYQLALAFAQQNKRNLMIDSFIDTYEKDTTHLKAIAHLASSFNKLKDRDSTQLFVEKGLELDKNHINLNRLKINQLYREKKYKEAIPFLLHLDTIDKKDTYSISMLGRVYYNLDSLEKSKKYFKKLSFKDKENFKPWTYLGHIALKEKNYISAKMNYYVATFKGKEKRDEEYFGLGTVSYELKKPKEAINFFKLAYEENKKNYKALYQLAKLSDDYYKDKKIAYKHYIKYMDSFQSRDEDITNFVRNRIKEIKKEYFLKGEDLE